DPADSRKHPVPPHRDDAVALTARDAGRPHRPPHKKARIARAFSFERRNPAGDYTSTRLSR
ncbi:hypothetical protein, partial [Burkholderia sp. E168m23]|uniref:hypothetical protein n=1 Tax=Burkholderia sp. E168m23 TaxID=1561200 RepID=UPI001F317EC9